MIRRLVILIILVLFISPGRLSAQGKPRFSGDAEKYRDELTAFMGPNLNPEQLAIFNQFINKWDSTSFNNDIKNRIIENSGLMSSRLMRPVPHFIEYFRTIIYFINYERSAKELSDWMKGLNMLLADRKAENERINE